MPQRHTEAPVELAMQEFEVDHLEDLDAPGWSDAVASAASAISIASLYSAVLT